LCTTTAISL
jgi:hypothetical protein